MLAFRVDDMTCGHCVSAITKAIGAVDAGAKVEADVAAHLVRIQPASADAAALSQAIAEAGYTPVAVEAGSAAPRAGGGCCCGDAGARSCG